MNDNLYNLYLKTLQPEIEDKSYRVASINNQLPHRVGCSNLGYPMLFIECSDKEYISDIKLSLFRVLFNRKCSLTDIEKRSVIEKEYTIIEMATEEKDLTRYFYQVVSIVLQRLPEKPKVSLLKKELSKIIEIFNAPQKFSKDIVCGLWAELLVIERSADPEYLIKAWHEDPEDKFDFNDSIDKIEVKSTAGNSRTHVFSLEQLYPNDSSKLLIASILVNSTGMGKTIFDLVDMISANISDTDCSLKLNEIVIKTIGMHVDECNNMFFDYNFAIDSMRFYNSTAIPSIDIKSVPISVSAVHFRSDLTNSLSIEEEGYDETSILFKSL